MKNRKRSRKEKSLKNNKHVKLIDRASNDCIKEIQPRIIIPPKEILQCILIMAADCPKNLVSIASTCKWFHQLVTDPAKWKSRIINVDLFKADNLLRELILSLAREDGKTHSLVRVSKESSDAVWRFLQVYDNITRCL